MATDKDLDTLVKVLASNIPGGNDFWPLKPLQLFPYIDVDQAVDLFYKIKDLEKRGVSIDEVAKVVKRPSLARHFIANIACTGLKVANKLKVGNIKKSDQTMLASFFIDVLKKLTSDDPFCEKGTNNVYSQEELDVLLKSLIWKDADASNIKVVNSLSVDLVSYIWTFYWPYFPSAGFETYGPYDVSEFFGKKSKLVIKDNYNLKPVEVWPEIKGFTYESVRIYQVYDTQNIRINYSNRILSEENLPSTNTKIAVKVNGRNIGDYTDILSISKMIEQQTKLQTERVNILSDMDKVRKGAMLSYYSLKNFYTSFWDSWYPEDAVNKTLEKLGDKFILERKIQQDRSNEQMALMFDPRNDFLP